jgi:hypothetical protein
VRECILAFRGGGLRLTSFWSRSWMREWNHPEGGVDVRRGVLNLSARWAHSPIEDLGVWWSSELRWLGRDASSSRAGGCKSRGGSTQDRVERPDIDDQCGQREDGGTKIDAVDEEAGVFFSRGPYRRQRGWVREEIEDSKRRRSSWVEMDGGLGWSIETEDAREGVNPSL